MNAVAARAPKLIDPESKTKTNIGITVDGHPFATEMDEQYRERLNAALETQDSSTLAQMRTEDEATYNYALYELANRLSSQLNRQNVSEHINVKNYFLALPGAVVLARSISTITYRFPNKELQQIYTNFEGCHRAVAHGRVNEKVALPDTVLAGLSLAEMQNFYDNLSSRENYEPARRLMALKGVFGALLGDPSTMTACGGLIVRASKVGGFKIPDKLPESTKRTLLQSNIKALIDAVSMLNEVRF